MDISQLPQTIQVLIILSPMFAVLALAGYLIKRGFHFLSGFSFFWLGITFLFICLYFYGMYSHTLSTWHTYRGLYVIAACFITFLTLKRTKTKKKK